MPQVGFKPNIPELQDRAETAMASPGPIHTYHQVLYAHITRSYTHKSPGPIRTYHQVLYAHITRSYTYISPGPIRTYHQVLYAHITLRAINLSMLNSATFSVKQIIYPNMFRGPLVSMITSTNYNY